MTRERGWSRDALDAIAWERLARSLPASELWSLLLDVFAQRAAARTPAGLCEQWERDGFVQPAAIDQRTINALDGHVLAAASAFEAIELSPLAPLGVCSIPGLASQNKIVSALRGTEVVSDPTNVFALECARRLRRDASRVVRLATCHRCVRAQPYPKLPGFAPHFRIFCLGTAGREQQGHAFTVDALVEHVETMHGALDRLEQHGYAFGTRGVTVMATAERAVLADRVAARVRGPVTRTPLEHRYYNGGLRYQISIDGPDGTVLPMIDGGVFDWVGTLAANKRLVFVASGMGTQLAASLRRRHVG
jgi:hypothetical protein